MRRSVFVRALCVVLLSGCILTSCSSGGSRRSGDSSVFPGLISGFSGMFSRNYASDYDLEVGEQKRDDQDRWSIWKRSEHGRVFLQIMNTGYRTREEDIDHLLFRVYDSEAEASAVYEDLFSYYTEYDPSYESGDSWFESWEPDVCDASVRQLVYLQGNVIIFADLSVCSCWSGPDSDVEVESSGSYYLKDYVLENAPEIRDRVIAEIVEPGMINK